MGSGRKVFLNTFFGLVALALLLAVWRFETFTSSSLWLSFLGGFHPVLLHLPIGVWVVIALGSWFKVPSRFRRGLWWLAALSSTASFGTGFLLGAEGGYDALLLERHLWAASAFTIFCWLGLWVEIFERGKWVSHSIVMASGAALVLAGHNGGVMVHGDPLAAAPWRLDPQRFATLPPLGETVNVYEDLVTPILGAKCISCHGPAKQKGRLRLDSIEGLRKGGHEGLVIRAGNVEESDLITVIKLPIRDEKHMPPKGHPQLSEWELNALKYWIAEGAREEATVLKAEAPPAFAGMLVEGYRLLPDKEEERLRLLAEEEAAEWNREERARLEAALKLLPQELQSGFHFSDLHSARLVFNRFGSAEIDETAWEQIEPLILECEDINLSSVDVQGPWIQVLAGSKKLRRLNLSETQVGDQELAILGKTPRLISLNIFGTRVEGIQNLGEGDFEGLENLYIGGTRLGEAALEELKRRLPDCAVWGDLTLEGVAQVEGVAEEEKSY